MQSAEGSSSNPTAIDTKTRAEAICGYCGCGSFHLRVLSCGCVVATCPRCYQAWTPPDRGSGQHVQSHEAMGEVGDVGAHMVSAEKRKFDKKSYMREYMKKRRVKPNG